ncbi:uncharacterized protein LOC133728462 [Rosa rugosa]|uniref:uncharacterized protein LOC133728462 n=1 Tax=Rosa rugosa TaxID=74645 RepID=UPI002B4061C2|nr:uncharacterized protein LOC133728462 [Rosa rugosa]
MNVLSWNCQGIGNPWTVNGLKGLIALNSPDVIFLCETKCTVHEMTKVKVAVGFQNAFTVPCRIFRQPNGRLSRAGGLCLLWKEGWDVALSTYSNNHIDVLVGCVGDRNRWRFTGVYGHPKVEQRYLTWELIKKIGHNNVRPWLLGGDINEILRGCEKEGGPPRCPRQIEAFSKCVEDCGLADLNFVGPCFTWRGIRGGEEIKVRLDRFLANREWMDLFLSSRVIHLKPSKSDHLPIFIEVSTTRPRKKRKKKRFRFEAHWLQDAECANVVRRGWNEVEGLNPFHTVCMKIERTRQALWDWSKEKFGNLKVEIEKVRAMLSTFYDKSLSAPPEEERLCLEAKLNDLLLHEHNYWKQCSQVMWLTEGDLNSRYFHQKATNRRRRNEIKGLYNSEGVWCTEESELEKIVLGYFGNLFTTNHPTNVELFTNLFPQVISNEMNSQLIKEFSEDEVLKALKQMHPMKAPGPDGFSPIFYQRYWPVVGKDVTAAIRCFMGSEHLLREVNGTYVTLIPKVKAVEHMQQLRPISLCNNVRMEIQEELASVLGVERVDKHDKYLGLPTEVSYSKTEAFQFIMEKTRNKMKGWKEKMLSMAGKEVMIKSVVQSVPTYVMSCFELPKHMCQEMHRCMAEFWWGDSDKGRKIHWLAWDKMCATKEEGGLGFRNMELFNQALLAKQGWRLLKCPNSLLATTLRAKYYPDGDFLNARVNPGDSYTWRSLMKGRDLLHKGVRYQVGTGSNISMWFDPWIPRPHTFKPFSGVMEGLEGLRVSDLIDPESREWMHEWLEELFTVEEMELIRKIPLSRRSPDDRLVWHYDNRGVYNAKSGYHVARSFSTQGSTSQGHAQMKALWRTVWHARVQSKIRVFVWRLLKHIILTKAALNRRFGLADQVCNFCNCDVESDLHIFKECNVIACLWLFSPLGLPARNHAATSLKEWIIDVIESLNKQQVDMFFILLWAIWSERNRGRLKINLDAAFNANSGSGGIGIVIRDDKGRFKGAWSRYMPYLGSALHGEAEACRAGLLLAVHQGWKEVEVESDCTILVAALNHNVEDNSEVSRILDDCRDYLQCFDYFRIHHIYREANSVAHRFAHFASLDRVVDLSLVEAPDFLQDVPYEDLCNATMHARGTGTMARNRRARRETPPIEDDEQIPRRFADTFGQFFRQIAAALPGSRTDYSVERARKHGAQTFASAASPVEAQRWLDRMERVFS